MTQVTPERIATLPKWAQHHIEKLEGDVGHWREVSKSIRAVEGRSPVYWTTGYPAEVFGIPPRAPVYFDLEPTEDNSYHREYISFSLQQDPETGLWFVNVNAGTCLSIEPRAANSIHLDVERRTPRE